MRRHRIIACVLVTVACALAGGTLLLTNNAKAKAPPAPAPAPPGGSVTVSPLVFFPPLPPVPIPPDAVPLDPSRAYREADHFRHHALQSRGLRLLPMPRPDDGRHVRVGVKRQPRRRSAAGGRPGPGRPSQGHGLPLRGIQPRGAVLRRRDCHGVRRRLLLGRSRARPLDLGQAAVGLSGRDEQYPHQRDLSRARRGLFRPRRFRRSRLSIRANSSRSLA